MTKIIKRLTYGMAAILCAAGIAGCATPKNVSYFQDATPETIINVSQPLAFRAKPGDKLVIVVKTRDAAVSALFNNPVFSVLSSETASTAGYVTDTQAGIASGQLAPYTIDEKGDIDFPVLGKIHISGMTRAEIVEFINSGVSVLGQVLKPGRIDFNKDYMTITDALALAGDITIKGMRDNVKVLRNIDGKIYTYTVDLTNAEKTITSPAYYLQQNDVVYVEPNNMTKRETIANGNSATNISFWVSAASLLATVVTTLGVFIKK